MPKADLTDLAHRLERHLGDPHDPASRMPYTRVLEYDEREEYPYEFVNLLQRWGAADYSLPRAQGGKAGDVEIGFNLMRLIARRDPTTATAFIITSLSFMPAWTAGTDEQKRDLVEAIQHGTRYAWGLSERRHGSDLTANELTAEKTDGGWLLTGEKWLIGNGRVSDGLSVHARTDPRGGPGGYSVFVLDKRRTPAGSVDELPRERMHGLRGLDMSGFRLDRVFVPDSALLGRAGQGLEIALKTSQTARALISGIALSAVDTGLRVTLDFTEGREVFGRTVSDIPYSRRQLVECFADLMVADAVSLGAVRALQVVPEQTSVWSSVVKYFVPTLLERTFAQLNVVLGARFYLRDHPHYAIHQKMMRDLPVANFADGNTVVNLKNIALQLGGLLATAAEADPRLRAEAEERAAVLFGIDRELPLYRPWDQELFSRGRDDALLAAPAALARLRRLAGEAKRDERAWLERSAAVAEELLGHAVSLRERTAALKAALGRDFGQSAELFDLAKEYCLLHATAACVHTHVHSAAALEDPLPSGALLLLQLERLRRHLRPHEAVTDAAAVDEGMRVLRHLHRENRLFSYWQFPLAERGDLSAARH
ncbi:acyl-CoA dehydrogenase family protein [Streptomyces viridochromogenes]|uniref:acyl-CoA dehydrogenase family protein n=1 Tax=Streptomyces viridochromogenes TaxID=1938 RepID=UPI00069CEA09|nr:acyl-CoA dehydrogenase family protein [Streptomyces viridochromogenes]KOG11510.1 acyl-CoA dehydrogenase [Streptomyces viridochromogenes]KOG11553.1 acyl-CoA dehydrogenase [Streptomyces viridochromogenes]